MYQHIGHIALLGVGQLKRCSSYFSQVSHLLPQFGHGLAILAMMTLLRWPLVRAFGQVSFFFVGFRMGVGTSGSVGLRSSSTCCCRGGVDTRGGVLAGEPTRGGITVLIGDLGEESLTSLNGVAHGGRALPRSTFKPVRQTLGLSLSSCSVTEPKRSVSCPGSVVRSSSMMVSSVVGRSSRLED